MLGIELALTLYGLDSYYPGDLGETETEVLAFDFCDERGCRMNYDDTLELCAQGLLDGRKCKVNRQGYAEWEDFAVKPDYAERARILVLGDSFSHGFSADLGKSFVETLERNLPEAVIWNAGIGATGTKQDLAAIDELAPILRPQLTILAFFINDFIDNSMPLGGWMQLRRADGAIQFVRRYHFDRWGNIIEASPEVVFAYAARGLPVPPNDIEPVIGATRIGSLILRFLDNLGSRSYERPAEIQVAATRQYLKELRDRARAHDSQLLVLLIPQREDFPEAGELYLSAAQIFSDLGMATMTVKPLLDAEKDYAPSPDVHWNNSGHQKVGALLSECVAITFSGGTLADCEHVTMP